MKLNEFVEDLQTLAAAHPNAQMHFEWVEAMGNGTCTVKAEFVDVKILDGIATLRLTEPGRAEEIKEWDHCIGETK